MSLQQLIIGILIPFVGTTLGASTVLFFKKEIPTIVQKLFLAFAAGVMIAASIWSLLIPAIEMTHNQGKIAWIPALLGVLFGVTFLIGIDKLLPRMQQTRKRDGSLKKTILLLFAVTLHNIPEGMAVGVVFASVLSGNLGIGIMSAFVLAIGIAIQNFPEGAIISLPLKSEGVSCSKSLWYGVLSGVLEPIAAIITIILTPVIVPILPYLLSFAAGAMLYVVVVELIPESQQGKNNHLSTLVFTMGFIVMMVLDVAFG